MAFTNGPKTITFTFQDDDLAQGSVSVKLPDTVSYDGAFAFAEDFVAMLTPLSDCALQKYTVSGEVFDDAYPQGAAGSDVEDKGVIVIRTANNGTSSFTWPGVKESVLLNTISPPGTYIDLANVNVAALLSALINGLAEGILGTLQPSDRRGADFLSVKEAYKQNRGSLKSRQYKG
jgi:hypothetical protein